MLQKYLTILHRDVVYNHDLIELKKEDYLPMKDNLNKSPERSPSYSPIRRSSISAFKTIIGLKYKEDTSINNNFYYSLLNFDADEETMKEA